MVMLRCLFSVTQRIPTKEDQTYRPWPCDIATQQIATSQQEKYVWFGNRFWCPLHWFPTSLPGLVLYKWWLNLAPEPVNATVPPARAQVCLADLTVDWWARPKWPPFCRALQNVYNIMGLWCLCSCGHEHTSHTSSVLAQLSTENPCRTDPSGPGFDGLTKASPSCLVTRSFAFCRKGMVKEDIVFSLAMPNLIIDI